MFRLHDWIDERLRPTLAHAHTNPAYRQHAFRFRTVNPTTAAINAAFDASDPALNTNHTTPSLSANYPFRLRFEIEETAGGGSAVAPTLWVSRNGGAYVQVGSASSVVRSLAATFADGAATTNLIASSARTFLAGWGDDVDATGATVTYTGNQHTELDFSLEVVNADVANGDTLDFRVRDGTTDLGTYGVTPRITVTKPAATVTQEAFRVRTDTAALNTDAGWSAAQNTNVSLEAEQTIRLRFRVKVTNVGVNQGYQLRYSRNGGAYTALPVQATPVAPGITPATVESTISGQFADGDAITSALLTGATGTFVNGSADEANNSVAAINLAADQYTEIEFAVRIRKFYWSGSAVAENVDGTTFDFRVYTAAGVALNAYTATPRVTVDSAGLVGGCWPEAPHFLGPIIDSNGAMYLFMESWELKTNGGWVVALKSTDGGLTWTAQDIPGGPGASAGTDDWEGATLVVDNSQTGRVFLFSHHTTSVEMHTFCMSDHALIPDQWGAVGTVVGTFTSVLNSMQWVAVTQRSDGDLILLYNTADATDNRTEYRVSTDGGANWSAAASLDATAGESIYNAWPVMAEADLCYIFYHVNTGPTDDAAQVYYKTLSGAGALSGRTQVSTNALGGGVGERGAIVGAAYYDDAGVEVVTVAWVDSLQATPAAKARTLRDGTLGAIETVSGVGVSDGGSSGSNQFVGDLSVDTATKTLHLLYADAATFDLWHDSEVDDGGWGTDTEIEDAIDCLWVRSNVVTRSGSTYLGYVYDNGTGTLGGGQGPVYYGELTLSAGGSVTVTPPVADALADAPRPTVVAEDHVALVASIADAIADAPRPTVTAETNATVVATPADALADAPAPTQSDSATASPAPTPADALGDAPAPTVTTVANAAVAAPVADAIADAPRPTVSASSSSAATVNPTPADAVADAGPPTVATTTAVTVASPPADALADGPRPTVTAESHVAIAASVADALADAPGPTQTDASVVSVPAVPADAVADAVAPTVTTEVAALIAATPADAVADAPPPALTTTSFVAVTSAVADAAADAGPPVVTGTAPAPSVTVSPPPGDALADARAPLVLAGEVALAPPPADAIADAGAPTVAILVATRRLTGRSRHREAPATVSREPKIATESREP